MNNDSPLIPQGSLQEQKNKGRSRVRIAIFFGLILHGIGLMAFLLLGGNHDTGDKTAANNPPPVAQPPETPATNPPPAFEPTNPPAPEPTNPTPATPPPTTQPTSNPTPPVVEPAAASSTPATTGASDYKIVKGDTLGKIARRSHVSLGAIKEANPGIDPAKLKIGQTIHIPASSTPGAGAAAASGTSGSGSAPAAEEKTYVVKSGDYLSKIATQFGVKVKALRAANGLKTDKIKVGQKLKIPERTAGASTTASVPTDLVPTPTPTSPATSAPPSGAGR